MPETYDKSGTLAVFKLTPTKFTQSSTVASTRNFELELTKKAKSHVSLTSFS